jgi:hypothetical protein
MSPGEGRRGGLIWLCWIQALQDGDIVSGGYGGTIYRLREDVWRALMLRRGTYVSTPVLDLYRPVSTPVSAPFL